LGACSTAHKGTYEVAAESSATPADAQQALIDEADAQWELRGDPAKLEDALAKYENVLQADPTNRHALGRLVRGWYFLGDGHLQSMDEKLAAWDTSITWGKKCLAVNTEFVALLEKGEKEEDAIQAATEADIPCIYWMASSLGKWSKASGLGKTLKNLPIVKAYQIRVTDLDPDYYFAGPDRYWGAYYAAIPSFAGQDLNLSREHFDAALEAYPDHLGNHVLVAEYWAVKAQDRAVFEEELKFVIDAPVDTIPELIPEQEAEKRKAEALLAKTDDLFL
jgi:tetratricopeptide (TPR) repeat protein